jgi:hypothetical protein
MTDSGFPISSAGSVVISFFCYEIHASGFQAQLSHVADFFGDVILHSRISSAGSVRYQHFL